MIERSLTRQSRYVHLMVIAFVGKTAQHLRDDHRAAALEPRATHEHVRANALVHLRAHPLLEEEP